VNRVRNVCEVWMGFTTSDLTMEATPLRFRVVAAQLSPRRPTDERSPRRRCEAQGVGVEHMAPPSRKKAAVDLEDVRRIPRVARDLRDSERRGSRDGGRRGDAAATHSRKRRRSIQRTLGRFSSVIWGCGVFFLVRRRWDFSGYELPMLKRPR
jgi:hypothetical protein